jgi:hypothetical protein
LLRHLVESFIDNFPLCFAERRGFALPWFRDKTLYDNFLIVGKIARARCDGCTACANALSTSVTSLLACVLATVKAILILLLEEIKIGIQC